MATLKVNKKEPIFKFDVKVEPAEEGQKAKTYSVELKRPTRSLFNEADMYYSIQLNKYIKMGLLTAEQLAKRQIDMGGTLSEDQTRDYAKVQALIAEKEEMFLRLMAQKELSPDEQERKGRLYDDISILRTRVMDYEFVRNQAFDHTANVKARNDVILWWVLHLAQLCEVPEGENAKEEDMKPMFAGETLETKNLKLEEMVDNDDPLLTLVLNKLAKVVTLWYWLGITDKEQLAKLVKEEQKADEVIDKPAEATNA